MLLGRHWDGIGRALRWYWKVLGGHYEGIEMVLGRDWKVLGRHWDGTGKVLGRHWKVIGTAFVTVLGGHWDDTAKALGQHWEGPIAIHPAERNRQLSHHLVSSFAGGINIVHRTRLITTLDFGNSFPDLK